MKAFEQRALSIAARGSLLIRMSSPGNTPLQISALTSKTEVFFNCDYIFSKGKHQIIKAQRMLYHPQLMAALRIMQRPVTS